MSQVTVVRRASLIIAIAFAQAARAASPAPAVTVTCNPASGVVDLGQRATWTIAAAPGVTSLSYKLKRGALTVVDSGPLGGTTVGGTIDAPGTLLLEVTGTGVDGKPVRAVGGAIAKPFEIKAATTAPDDFDAFWHAKLDELAAVPINAVVEPMPPTTQSSAGSSKYDKLTYAHVTLDNVRGTHVRGQLARPKAGEKLPALLIVQWAGVYPLERPWVLDRAAEGWLALNINAHDLPIDEPPAYYKQLADGPEHLAWYPARGNTDRDKSYFLRMYLGVARAIDYLKTRPDWDGKTIVVQGGSQGGLQSIVGAALRPDDVTAISVSVPAGCDQFATDDGRLTSWPHWLKNATPATLDRVRETSRYYDGANFASRVRCPALVGVGLLDETAPATTVCAAFNRFAGPKELVIEPLTTHYGPFDAYYTRATAWREAIVAGKPIPVQSPAK